MWMGVADINDSMGDMAHFSNEKVSRNNGVGLEMEGTIPFTNHVDCGIVILLLYKGNRLAKIIEMRLRQCILS